MNIFVKLALCSVSIFAIGKVIGDLYYALQASSLAISTTTNVNLMDDALLTSDKMLRGAGTSSKSPNREADDGSWHDIHVFVGKPLDLSIKYKKLKTSQVGQDLLVMQLLNRKQNGYFVDLAANHAVSLSNTYLLERDLQWHGLCIEPNPKYWEGHVHRSRCTTVAAVVGANRLEDVNFVVPDGVHSARAASGGIESLEFDNKPSVDGAKKKQQVNKKATRFYTVPLLEILARFQAPSVIDYLSLDVEGAEYFIMKGFPFDQYQIRIMTIERPNQDLINLLYRQDYVYIASFNEWGDETLFVHKAFLLDGSINKQVLESSPLLFKATTRLMEIPKDLMNEGPMWIETPLGPFGFRNYLKAKYGK
jgi:hypothetical protein